MGTNEEIKDRILEFLSVTTKWYTSSGLAVTAFRGIQGGDGLPVLGMGDACVKKL